MRWKLPTIRLVWLMAGIAVLSTAFASLRFASSAWAGAVVTLTLVGLACAILAAVLRRGAARAFWLGFALFACGYLRLTSGVWWPDEEAVVGLPTSLGLSVLYPYLDPVKDRFTVFGLPPEPMRYHGQVVNDPAYLNLRIREILEMPIPMPFAQETALEEVLNYIKSKTITLQFPEGLPIYIDPVGLTEAEKTMSTPVTCSVNGPPLRTSLSLMLRQLDMTSEIHDGVLRITSLTSANAQLFEPEAYHRIGHCWCAWLLGLIGGCAALYLHSTSVPRSPHGTVS